MKTIIAGMRYFTDYTQVRLAIEKSGFIISEVVSGCALGVDRCGEAYSHAYHLPLKQFPADWDKYGVRAGPIRNQQMAQYADALVAVWDGESKGTANMIKQAKAFNLKVFVHLV